MTSLSFATLNGGTVVQNVDGVQGASFYWRQQTLCLMVALRKRKKLNLVLEFLLFSLSVQKC